MNITRILNGNCFPGRDGRKPRWLIIHGTAGGTSALEIARFFQGTEGSSNPVSAHYVVDQQGVIYQCTLESDGAYANGVITTGHDPWWDSSVNPNDITISIEHVKPDSANATALTPAQQAASFALILDICKRNGIPMRPADATGGITSHASIDPINRARCPGTFDWNALWTYLANGGQQPMAIDLSAPGVSDYFEGGNDVWKCKKNGFLVGHGILGFYQKFGGSGLCGLTHLGLPTSNETVVLNKAGTTIGAVYQRFERGVLCYDPRHQIDSPPYSGDTYLAHIDSGIGQDPRVTALLTQVADLQEKLAELQPDALVAENAELKGKIDQAVKVLS